MREKEIEYYLVAQFEALGALVRKTSWVGRNHCPDRIVMLPNLTLWIEVKAPGKHPTAAQAREFARMQQHGQVVHVIDSIEAVDKLIKTIGSTL